VGQRFQFTPCFLLSSVQPLRTRPAGLNPPAISGLRSGPMALHQG
jgi:hypothetical protein